MYGKKNAFLDEKNSGFFSRLFFKILPELSDFINSDDCIGKILSKSYQPETSFNF